MRGLLTGRPGLTFLLALVLVAVSAPAGPPESERAVARMADAARAFLASRRGPL